MSRNSGECLGKWQGAPGLDYRRIWCLATAGGPWCGGGKEDQGQGSEGDTLRDMDGTPKKKWPWPELLCVAETQSKKPRQAETEFPALPLTRALAKGKAEFALVRGSTLFISRFHLV